MDINPTIILLQLAVYIGLIFVLKKLYIDPVLVLIKKRDSLTTGKVQEAERLAKQVEELKQKYEAEMATVRDELSLLRSKKLEEAQKASAAIIQKTKEDTNQKISKLTEEITRQQKELETKIPALSDMIAAEVVGVMTRSKGETL